jgi:hypothetical protein
MNWRQPLDRPASRLARVAGLVLVGFGLTVAAVFVLLPLLRPFVRPRIEILVAGCVWVATSIGVGVSVGCPGNIARAVARV